MTFVVSLRLGEPRARPRCAGCSNAIRARASSSIRRRRGHGSSWTSSSRSTRVDQVDLKGAYRGTVVDNPPSPELYRLVAEAFPLAWIEDPALVPEVEDVLAPHRERISWDAPIHSVCDVEALPFAPRALNVKPSRFGSLRGLCDFYDYAADRGIALYGGGQFELGVGRGQIQLLASLFHPDAPNDVAPGGYNDPEPPPGLPCSPLAATPAATGFQQERAGSPKGASCRKNAERLTSRPHVFPRPHRPERDVPRPAPPRAPAQAPAEGGRARRPRRRGRGDLRRRDARRARRPRRRRCAPRSRRSRRRSASPSCRARSAASTSRWGSRRCPASSTSTSR